MTISSFILSDKELYELTHKKQPEKQREWLASHGYQFDVRLDNSNVVLRSHVEKKLGGIDSLHATSRRSKPNWDAVIN